MASADGSMPAGSSNVPDASAPASQSSRQEKRDEEWVAGSIQSPSSVQAQQAANRRRRHRAGNGCCRRDALFGIAFLLHVIILYSTLLSTPLPEGYSNTTVYNYDSAIHRFVATVALGSLAGVGWCMSLWFLSRRTSNANRLPISSPLLLSHLTSSVLLFILGIVSLVAASTLVALGLLAIVIGDYLWLRRARERIAFMSEELALIVKLCEEGRDSGGAPGAGFGLWWRLVVVVFLASIVQAAFLLLWNAALLPLLPLSSSAAIFGIIVCFLSFRWVSGVLKHTLTFVVSAYVTEAIKAVVLASPQPPPPRVRERLDSLTDEGMEEGEDAQIQLEADGEAGGQERGKERRGEEKTEEENGEERARLQPISPSQMTPQQLRNHIIGNVGRAGTTNPFRLLLEALTTSFGSICAGALMGVASPVVWACRRGARYAARHSGHTFLGRCAGGIAARCYFLLDAYLRLSHKYSYVFVSTHHVSWFDAAHATWDLFHRRGVDAVIDDDVTDRMLLFGGYAGGAFLSLILGTTIHTPFVSTWLLTTFIVFSMGFVAVSLPLTIWEASISTLFVTYAQVPEAIAVLHPLLAHRFSRLSEVYLMARANTRIARISNAGDDL